MLKIDMHVHIPQKYDFDLFINEFKLFGVLKFQMVETDII